MLRQINDQIHVEADPETIFGALITPSSIQNWWSANSAIVLAERDGRWMASWGDDLDRPDYLVAAAITEYQPFSRLVFSDYRYFSKDGPLPFEFDTTVEHTIHPDQNGSLLTVMQSGFPSTPESEEFFQGCVRGWRTTLESLKSYVESSQ